MAKKYYDELNLMKGMAMFLAVVGHSLPDASREFNIVGENSFSEFMYHWIYSFHMAVFFFCAGFLFIPKIVGAAEMGGVFLKRSKRLLIPYFFYSLSYFLMKSLFAQFADHPLEGNAFVLMFFGVSPSFGCWFLWVMFVISLLFCLLRNVGVKWMAIIGFILYVLSAYIHKDWLIGRTDAVLRFSLWFSTGGLIAYHYDRVKDLMKNPLLGLLAFVFLTMVQLLDSSDFKIDQFGLLKDFLKTASGIMFLYSLACNLTERCRKTLPYRCVKLIGDYCMDIYLLSMFVLVPMRILYVNIGLVNYINYYVYILITIPIGILMPYTVSKYIIRRNKVLSMLLIGG